MKKVSTAVAVTAAMFLSTSALAGAKTQSGSANGLTWTAESTIVGPTSTGTVATGGNAIFLARNTDAMPGTGGTKNYSGTVGVFMRYANGQQFVCSGTLLNDRQSVATAGHCVSDGYAANPAQKGKSPGLVQTTVVFLSDANSNLDAPYYTVVGGLVVPTPGNTGITVKDYHINPNYTGEVIDQNDIAILRLSAPAPASAQSYGIYNTTDLTGKQFNVASFGTRSVTGGNDGTTGPGAGAGANRRRQGNNVYDYALGNPIFGGFFDTDDGSGGPYFGTADVTYSYLSDFDNGLAANDAGCLLATDFDPVNGAQYCSTGLGALEVSIAGGDSGGGAFINGQLASINSYGLTFGTAYGDIKCTSGPGNCLQSSFGEYNGFVPTFIHSAFIAGAIPEPSQWALMLVGFGGVGALARRRRGAVKATFA